MKRIIHDDSFTTQDGVLITFAECKAPREHIATIAEWVKAAHTDAQESGDNYYLGQAVAFELCLELLAGQILESDQ